MSFVVSVLITYISATLCFGFIAYLVYHGIDGWEWLLFAWLLLFGSISINSDNDKKTNKGVKKVE